MIFGIKIQSMKKRLFVFYNINIAILDCDVEQTAFPVAVMTSAFNAFRVEEALEFDVAV